MRRNNKHNYRRGAGNILIILILMFFTGCSDNISHSVLTNQDATLQPDYTSLTIPPNIAPLNFRIMQKGDQYQVKLHNSKGVEINVKSGSGSIEIPMKKWKHLLSSTAPGEYYIDVFIKRNGKWEKYNTITNTVASEPIDKYLVYRLIAPGYETWNQMGIYQRNLEDFKETPVMLNSYSDDNCMNCHSFRQNNSDEMMFHMRGVNSGTVIFHNDTLTKINTKTNSTISAGVYPSWHPNGNYLAFSVNNIVQSFHAIPGKKVEVRDTLSDIVIYNLKTNTVIGSSEISNPDRLETFPTWSPDGKFLYFCSAQKFPAQKFDEVHYDLFRIPFDEKNYSFGVPDTVVSVSNQDKSVSFPRISPDGRYLLFCVSDYGNFTIWHSESDLYVVDLTNGAINKPPINSTYSESYHTWSSSGRWVVFSSRRGDGLFTRPYFTYFDSHGLAHKPFLLPQKHSGFYADFLKSYNVPELVTEKVDLNPRKLKKIASMKSVNADFKRVD